MTHEGFGADELVAGIVAVRRGLRARPAAEDGERLLTWPGQALGLSQRESEMPTFITRGLSDQQIATRLYLSINSVKTYIRPGHGKIGVRNRAQAVAWG